MPFQWDASGLVTDPAGLVTQDSEQFVTEDGEDLEEE